MSHDNILGVWQICCLPSQTDSERWMLRKLIALGPQAGYFRLCGMRFSGAFGPLACYLRQLASIERGGLFGELKKAHGSSEITEVTRQRIDWQREVARD